MATSLWKKQEKGKKDEDGRKKRLEREAHCDADIRTVSRESRSRVTRLCVKPAAQGEMFLSRISSDYGHGQRRFLPFVVVVVVVLVVVVAGSRYVRASSMRNVRPLNNAENSAKKKIKVRRWMNGWTRRGEQEKRRIIKRNGRKWTRHHEAPSFWREDMSHGYQTSRHGVSMNPLEQPR